ncbi:hypothetical protein DEO72_LG2g4421 [Vigna unguiculata]|nr:hypothetical protein DEO72_LG2g3377 [Vigna unguiculata]QCD84071.1 hypothetical protein DEO72_LG2g4421 [Vigna unguiculata]
MGHGAMDSRSGLSRGRRNEKESVSERWVLTGDDNASLAGDGGGVSRRSSDARWWHRLLEPLWLAGM